MPLSPAPNLIEMSDFSGGWMPDLERTGIPANGLIDVLNLLPNIGSRTLEVRAGFKRISDAIISGYRVESVFAYNRLAGATQGQYLILVMTNDQSATAGNILVYAVNLSTSTAALISPSSKVWLNATAQHWGQTINQTFFGGGPGDPMYSWNPDDGWKDTPAAQNFPTLVDTTDPGPGFLATNYAFKQGDSVMWYDSVTATTQAYSTATNNRFKEWQTGQDYKKGDRVSLMWTSPTSRIYMRSHEATRDHTSSVGNKPLAGSGDWRAVNLSLPRDEEGVISDDWDLVPSAAVTNVAVWHAERLWLRYDNVSALGKSRLQFSAPSSPKKGDDVGTLTWTPTDFQVASREDGQGGGWIDVRTGDGDPITALWDFGYYLLVLKRRSAFVLAGTNESTWVLRQLANIGCIGPRAVCEHNGLVYFISDSGLYSTDGTQVSPPAGAERIRNWLRQTVNWENADQAALVSMWTYKSLIWISLPTTSAATPTNTLVYDPATQSFWLTDLSSMHGAINRIRGVEQMFFVPPTKTGDASTATYAWLGTRLHSQSTRTISGIVESNLFSDPNFEPEFEGQGTAAARKAAAWTVEAGAIDYWWGPLAKRSGVLGAFLSNNQKGVYKGISQTFAEYDTGTYCLSIYARRTNWQSDNSRMTYKQFRWQVDGVGLPEADHHFDYQGNGWWRVWATYAGKMSARPHRPQVFDGQFMMVDQAMCQKTGTPTPYFDGDGGEGVGGGVQGGDAVFVMEYDHPDLTGNPTDDTGTTTYASRDIGWGLRTAWLPFGVIREERRIRRIWGLLRGVIQVTLRAFRNYTDALAFEQQYTIDDSGNPVPYIEGLTMPDSYSISFALEGQGGPAGVLGLAVDTQPRRIRYHQ